MTIKDDAREREIAERLAKDEQSMLPAQADIDRRYLLKALQEARQPAPVVADAELDALVAVAPTPWTIMRYNDGQHIIDANGHDVAIVPKRIGRTKVAEFIRSAIDAITNLRRERRTREDYDLRCGRCNAPHWFDTSIPSEIWNQIARPEDLLCLLCIDELLAEKGLTTEAEFYFVGKALKSKLYDTSYGGAKQP